MYWTIIQVILVILCALGLVVLAIVPWFVRAGTTADVWPCVVGSVAALLLFPLVVLWGNAVTDGSDDDSSHCSTGTHYISTTVGSGDARHTVWYCVAA